MIDGQKIAVLINSLEGGGAQRVLLNVANGVANRGYKVDLLLVKAEGPYLHDVSPQVSVVDLNAKRALTSIPGMVHYLRTERPHVMITGLGHINNVALIARLLAGGSTRIVLTQHNTLSNNLTKLSRWRRRIMLGVTKRLFPRANQIIAVSAGVADDLAEMTGIPRDRILVIYNPVITPEMRLLAQNFPNHPWFAAGEPPVVLGVGSLTVQKDFATLIRAFARVRNDHPARLLILGDGPEREDLEKLAAELSVHEDVSLPGFVDNPFAYMSNSAVFVLSSRWEGLPTVVIEALYCGAPIVSTDCPNGPQEILAGGRYGKLVPIDDVAALAAAMADALDSPGFPADLDSWQPFEQETVIDQYLEVLYPQDCSKRSPPDDPSYSAVASATQNV